MALRRVVIVGGGSAGWITAAYMDAVLNGPRDKAVAITLIEDPATPRIGVGEATVPSLRDTMRTIGVDERDFMRATDATFKQAIKFVDWLRPGHHYYHPFDRRPSGRLDRAGLRWLTSDRRVPFADTVSPQPALCEAGLAPKLPGSRAYEAPLSYAYHVDADKLADYLSALARGRGVQHVTDAVVQVHAAQGRIDAVTTADGTRFAADLFVDCTGFAALLSEQTLGVGLEDYSPWLLCDRAVTMRVPYSAGPRAERPPFTTATALPAGWVWDIALRTRRGIGYVYASRYATPEAAEAALRDYEGPHAGALQARHLRFRVGRREQAWHANCVAIGLSSGFIEPLESTGIFLVEMAAATLCEYFPFGAQADEHRARFNAIMRARYEEILDFVALHYCLSRRDDAPLWREVARQERIPPRLRSALALWQTKTPSLSDCHDVLQLFSHTPYEYVLYGMDFQRERIAAAPSGSLSAGRVPGAVTRAVAQARERLPGHDAWLARHLGYATPGGA